MTLPPDLVPSGVVFLFGAAFGAVLALALRREVVRILRIARGER